MTLHDNMKKRTMELIVSAKDQRLRPREVEKIITHEFKTSRSSAHDVLKDLVEEGELVYAYRDPCSYVEFPCNGCQDGHQAARPMKVIMDGKGDPWICDVEVNPDDDLPARGCWSCGDVPFTRS